MQTKPDLAAQIIFYDFITENPVKRKQELLNNEIQANLVKELPF